MKKIIGLVVCILLLTCGCGKFDITKAKAEFKDKVNSANSYNLVGTMEIYNNDDTYKYNIVVDNQQENYRVSMINQNNNHEQIILKNDEAVYVVTPSLNKSFKFDSVWPDNSSQSYILSSLLNDILNDDEATLTEEDGKYLIKSTVNYPHNQSLEYQKLYFDSDMDLEQVIVYDGNDTQKIKVNINKIDYKAKYDDDYFNLETLIDEAEEQEDDSDNCSSQDDDNCQEDTQNQETSALEDILYPLYIPTNTYLNSTDTITNENVDRAILTFDGDSSFILVEEAATIAEEFEIIPVAGDPLILTNCIAALSENSLTWVDNNTEYYLTSSNLSTDELMTIASSLSITTYTEK